MTGPDKMDEYKTEMPYGSRFGYRTPPPEFAKSYVEPLSPLLGPAIPQTSSRNDDVPPLQQPPNTLPLAPTAAASLPPAPARQSLFSSYPTTSRFNVNTTPVDYGGMGPMEMFADIALSTAPPSFIASRSQQASHAPTAPSTSLRSSSIPSPSKSGGVLPATWSADGYPTRNGKYTPAYPPQSLPPHAINSDGFHTAYTFERRTSATRLEPPIKSPVITKTPASIGDSFTHSSPPLGLAASPRSQQLSFSPATTGYRPERLDKKRYRRDAKENATPSGAGAGKSAGSSRDGHGSRNNHARGRGAASGRQSSRKSRTRALSPIKDIAELEKPILAQPKPKPKPVEHKVSDIVVANGRGLQSSPVQLSRFTASAIESNDPPSPSPAYSPFPSRPTSPINEAIPLVSGGVGRVGESLPKTSVPEDVPIAPEPGSKPEARQVIVEQAAKEVAIEDVKSTVVEVLVDGNIKKVTNEAPESLGEIVAIFSKPQESPDSGAIDSGKEQAELLNQEITPAGDVVVQGNIPQGSEVLSHKDKTPSIEPLTNDIATVAQPVVAGGGAVPKEEAIEDITEDISMVDAQPIEEAEEDIPIKENEDFEFAQAVGNEPVFGAGDVLNNGLPLDAFDLTQEVDTGAVTGSEETIGEPKQLPILSPSGELSREPGDPDNEICGECDTKYRDSYGFRLDQVAWIGCDGCGKWYHSHCLKLDDSTVKRIDKFYCAPCEPTYGKSTMKRTSTRATTAIDYNALHNGSSAPIKNPNDSKLHPYVAIIRDRTHTFAADNLPRLRPDQVTVEFIDDMSTGWNQPFVVPATENPAPWIELSEEDKLESEKPRSEQDYLNMSMTPEASPPTPGLPGNTLTPFPPPPPRSPRTTNDEPKGSKKSKGNTPEMTLDNGDFDQKEVNRIKKTLVEGEYDVKERRPGADCLDMVIPEGLTVRKVGELIGAQMKVEMINVLRQSTTREDKWQMEDLVQYFESKDRSEIYNCISCEVTNTPLGAMISRPEVVRKLDLSDKVWRPSNDNDVKPHVGKYVLMSVADSFTDFHIDFAGSSVFYHIYEGQKIFLVLPPTDKNLEIYEQWSMNPDMNTTFFPRLCDDPCMLVTLNKGDTMFIPSGWIHAVYTPKDSLVIGGNFLTRSHYTKQMAIQKIEVVTDTKISQRYPKYTTLMWHTLYNYLASDPIPTEIDKALAHGRILRQKKFRVQKGRPAYTRQELEGLPDLCNFLLRTALIHCGSVKTSLRPGRPGLTARQIEAVKRAIPTPCNEDPLKWVKRFSRWCIWKRVALKIEPVGERVPEWAQGKWVPEETTKKGPSKAELKRLERLKLEEARRAEAPRRQGLRVRNMRTSTTPGESESNEETSSSKPLSTPKPIKKLKRKSGGEIEPTNKKRGRPNKTPLKTPTGPKKINSEDSAVKSKRKGKGKGHHATDGGDGEAFTLSDGSIYVAKESNLGPARAGCQNCRMKKTGCKHKAEIAELVAKLEANGGVLPEADNKGKGKAKVEVQQGLEEEEEEEEEEEGGGDDEENESILDKGKGKQEPDDEDLDMAVLEDEYEEEEKDHAIPTWAKESTRRLSGASSSKSQKRVRLAGDEDSVKDQTPPKKAKVTKEALATPAQLLSGVAGRPPGFQGRKPSCEECKALKTKCHHDTWHLAKVKTPAKSAKGGARRKSAATSARISAPRRSIGNDTSRPSKPANDSQRSSSKDAEDRMIEDDEQEELEDVIVCKKPMSVTSAVKVTASAIIRHSTPPSVTPALSSVIVASGPPSTPAKRSPPVAGSSANTSPLTENEFDLDLSVLDEQLPYKPRSRSSNTPDDPTIMAPPVDFDDEPAVTPVALPTVANGVVPVATTNTVSNLVLANYPIPAYRVHKPKVTYTRNNKNFKRKADEDEDAAMGMNETSNVNSKLGRAGPSMSPGAEKRVSRGASTNGSVDVVEEGDISVEELKRLGTAADFGLRRRAGS